MPTHTKTPNALEAQCWRLYWFALPRAPGVDENASEEIHHGRSHQTHGAPLPEGLRPWRSTQLEVRSA